MVVVSLLMLLVPGLISIQVLWRGKDINKSDYKYIVCDYLMYSFLILLSVYFAMFLFNPERTISFSAAIRASSNILMSGFVVKYSATALIASLLLPVVIPKVYNFFFKIEKNRAEKEIKK